MQVIISFNQKRRRNEEKFEIVSILQEYLTANNAILKPLLSEFRDVVDLVDSKTRQLNKLTDVRITLHSSEGKHTQQHRGTYNLPTARGQVGAIIDFDESNVPKHLEVVLSSPKEDSRYSSVIISSLNYFYDGMQYPLLIPNGDIGYSFSQKKFKGMMKIRYGKRKTTTNSNNEKDETEEADGRLTGCMFYSQLYIDKVGEFNYINRERMLFQKYVVDNYVKIETCRLNYFEGNQKKIRKESFDVLKTDNPSSVGQRIIIPPSFVGGPRYMKQKQQDALTFIGKYGSPDLFITFTMNPDWPEFEPALAAGGAGCTSNDRPDLVSRVFRLKLCALMDDLTKVCIFGCAKAFLYTVEWQKRGLPHCHVLLWLETKIDKTDIDSYISAEIPDPNTPPRLYKIVTSNIIHNPCVGYNDSSPCIVKNKCSKNFPKPYRFETLVGNNGYPLYRRRAFGKDSGRCFEKKMRGREDKVRIDNAWLYPTIRTYV